MIFIKKRISFFIDRKKELLNSNVSLHYHDKGNRAARLREKAQIESEKFETPPFNNFIVEVLICPPTRRKLDPPNLYPTVKHLIDGMTDNNWWPDDDWTHMKKMSFSYGGLSERKGAKGDFQVIITVTEIEEELI